jgi:predicted RNA-binding protein YlqC (UPF0109 family)
MTAKEQDEAFLEYVIKALVDHPDDVKIDRRVDEMGVLITLDVHPEDMGKIIGRSGSTAKAIRTLLRVIGFKNNARVNLKINEPAGGKRSSMSNDDVSRDVDQAIEDLKM